MANSSSISEGVFDAIAANLLYHGRLDAYLSEQFRMPHPECPVSATHSLEIEDTEKDFQ